MKLSLFLMFSVIQVLRGQEINFGLLGKLEYSLQLPGDSFRLDLDYSVCCTFGCDPNLPIFTTLAQFLKENPGLKLEIAGHTDCRGNEEYNFTLSQRRAGQIRDFLIGQGIIPERLSAIGYGETRPSKPCSCSGKPKKQSTDAQHHRNRRVMLHLRE